MSNSAAAPGSVLVMTFLLDGPFLNPDASDLTCHAIGDDAGAAIRVGVTESSLGITGNGRYHKRCVRAGGQWRIASLKLTRLLVEMSPQPKAL